MVGVDWKPQVDHKHNMFKLEMKRISRSLVRDSLQVTLEEPALQGCSCLLVHINQDTVIVAIYRSPSVTNIDNFNGNLDQILQSLTSFKNVIITGDININIIPDIHDAGTQDYLNLCSYHGFYPAHTLPTHQSGSCLDHMMIKSRSTYLTLVTKTPLTDHSAVLLTLNLSLPKLNHKLVKSKLNIKKLEHDLCKLDFAPVFQSTDANASLLYLINNVEQAILHNTSVVASNKQYQNIKPWITPGIIRCIRHRDKLHMRTKKYPDNLTLLVIYRRYRNFVNNLLKKLKANYEKNELLKAGKDSKRLWRHIKNFTYTSKRHESCSSLLLTHPSPLISANYVNNYFINMGKDLAERHQPLNLFSQSLNATTSRNSFVMLDTDQQEILQIITNLKDDSAVGFDNISNKILKTFKHILIPPLTRIFQICLSQGIFPQCLKKAVVTPVYKSGCKDQVNNYRPISVLPSLSKLLEKIINKRLIDYLEKNNYLSPTQFGFRAKLSTADAVHNLTNYITQELGKGKHTLAVFLDLAKAFDTVSIPKLLKKLEALGIRGTQLKLFADYLDNRSQCVKIGNIKSDYQKMTCYGIPQGSIIGPTLFLVYINDLCNLNLKCGKIISYADDTALIFSANSRSELYEVAQLGLNGVNNWLRCNLLTLNTDKTNYIHFSMRQPCHGFTNPNLYAHQCQYPSVNKCDCPLIQNTSHIKYLGILINDTLSFRQHIANLVVRIRKLMYIFKKLRTIAGPKLIKQVVPWGLRKTLNWIKGTYGNPPVFITENGISLEPGLRDPRRINYIDGYLRALHAALTKDKCNVYGYTYWSLIDNFEWTRGYSERFGLYEVDYSSKQRVRTARQSAEYYSSVATTKCLPDKVSGYKL
ncbi:hypothetical protein evm_012189 [Chilo suppressalis]|nr:hypothetical protein evm_012189 [Chilo suppressalis]